MYFLRCYFFKNEPLIICPFLSSKLDSPVIKTLERHFFYIEWVSLQYFDYRRLWFWWKKWATAQSFICKEVPNFLQNPNFKRSNITVQDPTGESQGDNLWMTSWTSRTSSLLASRICCTCHIFQLYPNTYLLTLLIQKYSK